MIAIKLQSVSTSVTVLRLANAYSPLHCAMLYSSNALLPVPFHLTRPLSRVWPGLDVFGFGGEALHSTIEHVLLLAYDLLNRPVSAQILRVMNVGGRNRLLLD